MEGLVYLEINSIMLEIMMKLKKSGIGLISKTKFIFNDTTIKAGKYKNGKWQYKTILKHKMEKDSYIGIEDIAVCGNKLLVKISGKNGKIKLYMTDLNGKNKKLLHKGDGVG